MTVSTESGPKLWRQSLSKSIFKKRQSTSKESDFIPFNAKSTSPFLNLPGEIRTLIYEYSFASSTEEVLRGLQFGHGTSDASGLLLTCRQIRHEARQLSYGSAVIALPAGSREDKYGVYHKTYPKVPQPLPLALRYRPGTVNYLSLRISLFRNLRNPIASLVDDVALKNSNVRPEVFYLQVCICDALAWLNSSPDHVMTFCIATEHLAMRFPTLRRIVIYYCGLEWPSWLPSKGEVAFPQMVCTRHLVRSLSGANWGFRKIEEGVEKSCRCRTELSWNHMLVHPGQAVKPVPWTTRKVEIEYYDSFTVLEQRCVRNKPLVRPAMEGPQEIQSSPSRNSTIQQNQISRTGSQPKSRLKSLLKDVTFRKEWVARYDMDARTHR